MTSLSHFLTFQERGGTPPRPLGNLESGLLPLYSTISRLSGEDAYLALPTLPFQ